MKIRNVNSKNNITNEAIQNNIGNTNQSSMLPVYKRISKINSQQTLSSLLPKHSESECINIFIINI